ncbi:DUF1641 domain-containing protein [Frigoriglobus tundricola]|uniref:DUF1641 domain-containing protein n=1 Tax=Frigoriglobus tundricola TaxID=2774151 RepID=A0A6M5YNM8_9BACT|nr:DUF1641 domain-containing protein [Frigoriglobus tundricola]QJW94970.1 hypothetical protein FTUN_2496 [Frigoriglobus tundricola]
MDTNGHAATPPPSHQLLRRLDDPKTAATLERLLDRLDVLAFAVEATDSLLRRGEQLTDNIGDVLREAKDAGPGVDGAALAGKLPQLATAGAKLADVTASPAFARLLDSGLLDRLADPATLAALTALIDRLPLLAFGASALDGLLRRGEELADNVADSLQDARQFVPPIDPLKLQEAAVGLPKVIDAVTALINAGLFDPEVVAVLVEVGKQAAGPYREAKQMPDHLVGMWGLVRAMRDPDVQRALGVGLYIAKRYGQTFNRSEVSPPPAGGAGS